jgi:hypothetical protein
VCDLGTSRVRWLKLARVVNARERERERGKNKSFETVEQFKYLGTTLTNENFIHEEIKSRLKSGNAFYHSVQNLFIVF